MMYPYVKYSDNTEVVFSDVYIGENGEECIDVHFEGPTKTGFDSVRITLPSYKVKFGKETIQMKKLSFLKK